MISALEALEISTTNRLDFIESKIKLAASNKERSVSLVNSFRLKPNERNILSDLGYVITEGHSGKNGNFDIISW